MTETVVKKALVPKMRFPGFSGEWDRSSLGANASLLSDRVGDLECVPLSITSGTGLVSQVEKFGRTIAGGQYKNYIRLQEGDFAYNKSATKAYPQGYIARYRGSAAAAVPSSIFTCFRADEAKVNAELLRYFFEANMHGKFLRERLTVGARAHGSLNVADSDLLETPIPLPVGKSSLAEQRKIADCLQSLDELIAAQTEKLEALKRHKRGLLQQLFPAEGETTPRLRFPQFRDNGDWSLQPLEELAKVTTGAQDTQDKVDDGKYPFYVRSQNVERINSYALNCEAVLTSGDGVGVGENFHYVDGKFNFHQRVYCVYDFHRDLDARFFFFYFATHFRSRVKRMSAKNSVDSVRRAMLTEMLIPIPGLPEQSAIRDMLGSIESQIAELDRLISLLSIHKNALMQQLFPHVEELDQ